MHAFKPLVMTLAACCIATSADADQTFVINDSWAIRNAWDMASDDAHVGTIAGCFETLIRVGYDGRLEPWLASDYQRLSPTTWELTLRPNTHFQDGAPLDADAVVMALDHLLERPIPARAFSSRQIASVEAVGNDKVRITTQAALANLPAHLASPSTSILSPAAYLGEQIDPVGHCTGPFIITAVDPSQGLKLEANADYWRGKPQLDRAELRFIADANTRAVQVRSGEAHISRQIPTTSYDQIENSGTAKVQVVQSPRITMLVLNNSRPPFDDPRVRRAVAMAIDKQAISMALFDGRMPAANGIFRPGDPWAAEDESRYDVARARVLLEEAGIAPGQLKLTLLAYSERSEFRDLAAVLQQMLGGLGIDVTIRAAQYAALELSMLSGDFDMALLSRNYLTDVIDPGGFLSSDFGCQGSYNIAHFCSPAVDEQIAAAWDTEDEAQRYAIYQRVAGQLSDQAVVVPLIHTNSFDAVSDRVVGSRPHPLNSYYLTPELTLR